MLITFIHNLKFSETVNGNQTTNFGEVQFFFRATVNNTTKGLALISVYDPPDEDLLRDSSNALWVALYRGEDHLKVIDIKSIATCVAMVPFTKPPDGRFFVCEKMGLEVGNLGGFHEDAGDIGDLDA